MKGTLDVNNITSSEVLKVAQQKFNKKLSTFTSNHFAKLWTQYPLLNDLL